MNVHVAATQQSFTRQTPAMIKHVLAASVTSWTTHHCETH